MCSQVLTNSVETFRAPLTTQALACLKRRMKESGPLALRSLAVLAVTIGADALDYFEGSSVMCASSRRHYGSYANMSLTGVSMTMQTS